MRLLVNLRFWTIAVAALLGLSGPALAQERGYVLGVDDTVSVSVYGQPEANVATRIKADGSIVVPLIGSVKAEGETVLSLADMIEKKFVAGGFFKNPVVNVEIGSYISKRVYVAGKVGNPGVYPLDRTYRVLEILLKASWVRDQGANFVYLRRADGKEIRLDTESLVRGAPDKDPVLQAGDTLYVPDAENFYITGAVNKPGALPLLPGMNVRRALALAGGVSATGSDKKIGLYRVGSSNKDEIDLDQSVQKNDVLVVKERLF